MGSFAQQPWHLPEQLCCAGTVGSQTCPILLQTPSPPPPPTRASPPPNMHITGMEGSSLEGEAHQARGSPHPTLQGVDVRQPHCQNLEHREARLTSGGVGGKGAEISKAPGLTRCGVGSLAASLQHTDPPGEGRAMPLDPEAKVESPTAGHNLSPWAQGRTRPEGAFPSLAHQSLSP